ncbi:MAG: hypothetical protein V4719_01735 [Planctomycetota bacterium]
MPRYRRRRTQADQYAIDCERFDRKQREKWQVFGFQLAFVIIASSAYRFIQWLYS